MEKFKELMKSDTPLLVDFYASWCGPCKTMYPIVEQVKEMLGERVHVVKYDVDQYDDLASLYRIRSIPTFVLFKKGKILWQHTGAMSAQALYQSVVNSI